MNRSAIRIIAIIVILAGAGFLVIPRLGFLNSSKTEEPSGPPSFPATPVKSVITAPELLIESISVTGTTVPDEQIDIRSEVSGVVESIFFNEGKKVANGQLLVKINDDDLQAQLQKEEYRQTLALQKEDRQKQLLEIGGVSQEMYDQSLTEFNTIKAEIDLIKVRIGKTSITAPFSGVIGLRNISVGSYINPNNIIAPLVKTNPIKIDFSIPERYAGVVKVGSSISFTIQGNDSTYTGEVYAKEPTIDLSTRTLSLKAICPNPSGELVPGAFASVKITLQQFDDAIIIPTEAVIPELGGQKVFLYKNGKAASQTIQTGIRQAREVQVTEGLQAGDTVITTGALQLRDGSAVELTSIKSTAE